MRLEAHEHAVTGHWSGPFDETQFQRWVEQLRSGLNGRPVMLGLVFMGQAYWTHAATVLEILRVAGRVGLLAGCSGSRLIVGSEEIEEQAGVVVGLYHMPGADLKAVRLLQEHVEQADGVSYWRDLTGIPPAKNHGWLVFADPFTFDSERWLAGWDLAYRPGPILGGLASGAEESPATQVYLDGDVYSEGGVAISLGGAVRLEGVLSQACKPIGEPWTITKAEGNYIHCIGNRPAYQVLVDTFNALPREQKKRAEGNLLVGLVANEYQEEHSRGDFLIRNLLGGDPNSGVIAVGARPRTGQSLQFQCRDAATATEDMTSLLRRARQRLAGARIYGGCLCSCSGRGKHLFGIRNHDAILAQRHLGPLGLTGVFCNGEIGPVGERAFLHGYTASLALFAER